MKKYFLLFAFPLILPSASILASKVSLPLTEEPKVVTVTAPVTPSDAEVQAAIKSFNSLSVKEKKMRLKEVNKLIKQYKADKKASKDIDGNTLLQAILAIFIPPLGVYLHEGGTTTKFWISVLLTILGLLIFGFAGILFLGTLPSIVYALVVIFSS